MTTYDRAIEQARDLLRWRSPLRTELWASRLAAEAEPELLDGLVASERPEARLALAALASLAPANPPPGGFDDPGEDLRDDLGEGLQDPSGSVSGQGETLDDLGGTLSDQREGSNDLGETPNQPEGSDDLRETLSDQSGGLDDLGGSGHELAESGPEAVVTAEVAEAGREALGWLPAWAARMGEVVCEGAWYGRGDRYGEQVLAALAFRYRNGKEPHLLVVGIDQPHGGLAVDAVVEEPKFLDDLSLDEAPAGLVAGRVLDAFEVTDMLMGAEVAESLPAVRALALARARSVADPVRHAPDETVTAFDALPDVAGADEAFGALIDFLGERPLWWSPARVSAFLTAWLPREAILSEAAIAAMPEVLHAWTRHLGDHQEVHARIDAEAPRLPELMADESLAGLAKRIARGQEQ